MDFLSVVVEAYADAMASVDRAGDRVREAVNYALFEGDLILEYTAYPDDGGLAPVVYGTFFDDSYEGCWDGCNGITTVHRSGWCRVNPEHADFDCMCGISPEDEDEFYEYLDKRAAEDRAAMGIEEPF